MTASGELGQRRREQQVKWMWIDAGGAAHRAAAQRSGRARQAARRRRPRSPPANWRRRWPWKRSRSCWGVMALTILVTGFGPFPGAPFNPTGPLVKRLARLRRPGLANVTIVSHIFPTSYAAVDRDLPKLLAKHKPDALLMFGLAPRAKTIRIETRARNTRVAVAGRGRRRARRQNRAGRSAGARSAGADAQLLAAARAARVPVMPLARCRALSLQLSVLAGGRSRGQARRPAPRRFRPCAADPPQDAAARRQAAPDRRRSRPRRRAAH